MAVNPKSHLIRFLGFAVTGDLGPLTLSTIRGNRLQAYAKAPPKEPASAAQQLFRQWMRTTASAWRNLTPEQRTWWKNTANQSGCRATGPGLWLWYNRKRDSEVLRTLARQAGTQFPPT